MTLVLASSSKYRQNILAKLQIPFVCHAPNIDETFFENESAQQLVYRLAKEKALKVANHYPDAFIIGSDQVATYDQQIIGKPKDYQNAVELLTSFSANLVNFYTGLCLYNAKNQSIQIEVVPFTIKFRELSRPEIDSYLEKTSPYNCAGGIKSEGLGVALFEKLIGDDPNTLQGLPLIMLIQMLKQEGVNPLLIK